MLNLSSLGNRGVNNKVFSGNRAENYIKCRNNQVTDSFQYSKNLNPIHFGSIINSGTVLKARRRIYYIPSLSRAFSDIKHLNVMEGKGLDSVADHKEISGLFPSTYHQGIVTFSKKNIAQKIAGVLHPVKVNRSNPTENNVQRVAVVLSGGQASGGHNVITGLYDALQKINPQNSLVGVLDGPEGLVKGAFKPLDDKIIDKYRNTGGFDMLGSSRTKIETDDQFKMVLDNCKKNKINSIVIIGGDDSNTNAAMLAERFKNEGVKVVGCPKTIDGDLKTKDIETSFGFDTATKIYSNLISNIQTDANSAKKHWHFIKLMGRSASHVAIETALQTHPNVTLISEEIEKNKMSLNDVVDMIAKPVAERAKDGKNYGTVIIPEGVIEFIPETKSLLDGMDNVVSDMVKNGKDFNKEPLEAKKALIHKSLPKEQLSTFKNLPDQIQNQLLQDRDPHGNLPVSQINTEEFLAELVKQRLSEMKQKGEYNGKFTPQPHFFGYEGRCAFPSNFDANYCYNIGHSAAALLNVGKTGYMAGVKNLAKPTDEWQPIGVPITSMLNMELRNGKSKPVIQKALVDLNGPVFKKFSQYRKMWEKTDSHVDVGSIQYNGPEEVTNTVPMTLLLEQGGKDQIFAKKGVKGFFHKVAMSIKENILPNKKDV